MRRRVMLPAVFLLAAGGLAGCDGGAVKPVDIKVTEIDPLNQFKAYLENYTKGAPVSSEATSAEELIGRIKQKHPDKADAVEKGWAEIMKVKTNPKAKAKELLEKLK